MAQISGVNPAMQGHSASANTPAALYAQEAQNSSLNIRDIIEKFINLREKRDTKAVQLIRQFYTEPRYLSTGGSVFVDSDCLYDSDAAYGVETELIVSQGMNTMAYRQMCDQFMLQLLQMRAIDVETFLKNSSLPYAEKVLLNIQDVNKKREEQAAEQQQWMMQNQGAQPMPQDIPGVGSQT